MYKAITNLLCCPRCRSDFSLHVAAANGDDVLEGKLVCENGHTYQVSCGVADFNSEEQSIANQWESLSEEQHFEALDREMDMKNPPEVIQRREMVLNTITDAVSGHDCKVVLDIASGRGLMLTELAKSLDDEVHLISADLSAFVLKYDYQKFKRIAPKGKISYLACDATNLPLKDGVVDAATTYCGFSNMIGCAAEALGDAHRVIKPGGILVDSFVVIEKNSKGYEMLHRVCTERGIPKAEEFFLRDGVEDAHRAIFPVVTCKTVFEGIGVGNGMDLLPYDGEWYAEQVYVSEK